MGKIRMMKRLSSLAISALLVLALGGCLEGNKAPVASFTRSPASGPAPLAVFFDGALSSDSDGAVVSYLWQFGDGSTASGVTATHEFASVGTHSVTLTVTDDRGGEAETVRNVVVTEEGAAPTVGTKVGNLAVDVSLPDVRTGDTLSLSSLRGHVVLLEFWRSTCPSCRSAMPAVEILRERFADDGLVVLLVSQDASAAEARSFLDSQGYEDTLAVFDDGEAVRTIYDVELVPRLFVVDRQGIIRYIDHPIRIRDRHIEPWL